MAFSKRIARGGWNHFAATSWWKRMRVIISEQEPEEKRIQHPRGCQEETSTGLAQNGLMWRWLDELLGDKSVN